MMGNELIKSAQQFIAEKEKFFKPGILIRTKRLTRDGDNEWRVQACTFMPESSYSEKVFVIERLEKVEDAPSLPGKENIQYRFGYFIIAKNGSKRGKWVWGQFCPMIPHEDLEPLLSKAKKEGTLL